MSKMKSTLGMLFMAVAMCEQINSDGRAWSDDLKPEPPIPKGCKEYFFNRDGDFSTEKMLKSECVFKCVALNDKSAIRKFNTWKKQTTDI